MDELWNMTEEQLEALANQASSEAQRKRALREMPAAIDQMVQQYQAALGRAGGDPWAEPTSVMDSYPYGAIVTHQGQLHESLKHLNMTEPGTDPEAWSAVQDGENE